MSTPRIKAIDHTVQLTHEWIAELQDRLDWADYKNAYRLLRVTLQALRDWLNVDEAAHLGAQFPMLVRGIYYEGWHPAKTPIRERSVDDFVARIDDAFKTDPIDDSKDAISAVFKLLNAKVSEGEIDDVRSRLPKPLRDLWPT